MKPILFLLCFFVAFIRVGGAQSDFSYLDSIYRENYKQSQYENALQTAFVMQQKSSKAADTLKAKILFRIGNCQLQLNAIDLAITALEKAAKIQQRTIPDEIDFAQTLNLLGEAYYGAGNYEQAMQYCLEALEIRNKKGAAKDDNYIINLKNLAYIHHDMGVYAKAISYYAQTANLIKKNKGDSNPQYAGALVNIGIAFTDMGEFEQAEQYLLQSLHILEVNKLTEHPFYANNLNNLAILYAQIKEYEKAILLQTKVVETLRNQEDYKNIVYANALSNLASLKNGKEAEKLYAEAKAVFEETGLTEHPFYNNLLNNLAVVYATAKQYHKALPLLLDVQRFYKKNNATLTTDYINCLNNLGETYVFLAEYSNAEKIYNESLRICEDDLITRDIQYIYTLNGFAKLYTKSNQISKAWDYCLQAIQRNTAIVVGANINQAWADSLINAETYLSVELFCQTLTHIYELLSINEQKTQQAFVCAVALKSLERERNEFADEEDKLRILTESTDWTKMYTAILDKEKDKDKFFELSEQQRFVLLHDAQSSKTVYSLGFLSDSLQKQEKELEKEFKQTKALLSEGHSRSILDSLRRRMMYINLKIDSFKTKIQKDYPKYAQIKHQHTPISIQDVQKILPPKTAIIEYLVIQDDYIYAFYIDNKRSFIQTLNIDTDTLKNYVKKLHSCLSNYQAILEKPEESYTLYNSTAHWFYRNILQPILAQTNDITNLIVIPDRELAHIPFECFLVEPAPASQAGYRNLHYLIKDYCISYNYSVTLWKQNKEHLKKANNAQILGIAADYKHKNTVADSSSIYALLHLHLNPLPSAKQEVEALSRHFKGTFIVDSTSTEKYFKANAHQYSIVHLAMHGLLDKKNPALSALAFTQNSDSSENHFLQAYEISQLELNADLVVLSACETGYGKFEQGNGTASLARAFMYAGVPALVVSLWEVNDVSTSLLMQNFYNNLSLGINKAEALRQAKLQYLTDARENSAHPAFWSAFVLIGEESPVALQTANNHRWLFIVVIAVAFLLLVLGFKFFKKR